MGLKVIAISLWGNNPLYIHGAMLNCREAPRIYPGWQLRFYVDPEFNSQPLLDCGAYVHVCPNRGGIHGMFWRFRAASDPQAERVIFRDADSVVNVREAAAVAAWVRSDIDAHAMFDHPHHHGFPFFGGMWGVKGGVIPDMLEREQRWRKWDKKPDDMHFLTHMVWPILRGRTLVHALPGLGEMWPELLPQPFPAHPPYPGFVGQQLFTMPWLK